jgi:hypothetical protein
MPVPHSLQGISSLDLVMPAVAAVLVILLMSRIREPVLHRIHVLLLAGFSTAYLGGGLGPWELIYLPPATYVAYKAMSSYRFVALGWFMHPVWDMVHHFYGNPLWPWMPTSSIGCAIFDPIIGIWAFFYARRMTVVPMS